MVGREDTSDLSPDLSVVCFMYPGTRMMRPAERNLAMAGMDRGATTR